MNKVEKQFINEGKAVFRHNIILLSKSNAIDFIKACEPESIKILGIDGFYLRGDSIQPSLEHRVDFTLRDI